LGAVPIQNGTRLGAYEVTGLIGHGAMGTVYQARHEALDRIAAVKVLHAIGDDPAAIGRFRREGRAIALLRHPNIVTVYDYGEFEGTPYMIEEYVSGGSLADRLKRGRPDHPTTIRWLRGMAAGLDYAHQKGIVHRDVKPANVLMTQDDSPVLADFGLAKVEQQATMTASGVATGTPAYMAPEQISDTGEISPSSDLYALATVAYEMLTGRLPYEADNVMRLLLQKIRDDPPPPSTHDPSLPRRIDSILLRGLARDPKTRWSSCAAMLEALAGVLEPEPQLFATTRRFERRRRFNWMNWAWLAFPVAGILTLLILFVVLPRLFPAPASAIVPCPAVSPPTQISASPNPATEGAPVTYSGSGFSTGDPFFVVVDSVGDCTNPTAGVKVYSNATYAEPLRTEPTPLPDGVSAGEYLLRACSHRTGETPTSCVQVPLSVGPAAPAAASPAVLPPSPPATSPTP
jgi:serine/threonine protein kinase